MPHYLFRSSYSTQGIQGVMREGPTARVAAIETLAASVGGKLLAAYWAFGDDDFVMILELPDTTAAMAISAHVAASGVARITTTVLLTAAEAEAAMNRSVTYRVPGA
jgi:uncharacterized protein with GYD domain